MEESQSNEQPEPEHEHWAAYANTVRSKITAWDLQIEFGQLRPELGSPIGKVDWHTEITIPWGLAKILLYYLQLNVMAIETEVGKIPVPKEVQPPEPPPLIAELAANETAKKVRELAVRMHKDFLASL